MMDGASKTQFFESALFESLGEELQVKDIEFKSGGCINNAVRLITDKGSFFIKWNDHGEPDMFEKEFRGLELLRKAGSGHVPQPFNHGQVGESRYLLTEYLDSYRKDNRYWENLGHNLALLHRQTSDQPGLNFNNYIGRLPQNNEPLPDWVDFFIERRLKVQAGLARYNGLVDDAFMNRFKKIYPKLSEILTDESHSLLHGDLWSGNVMTGPDGEGWLIDPAVYYGNREVDLGFTRLFGGFDQIFYDAYEESYPTITGLSERIDIYNLYPLLVHVNLFGLSYLSGVERIITKYIE
ncbi:fructosamine kinase family protein [Roseivirga sp. BDSF3-8]|uniref:fructosamine kinase family protein n=1 Tax=Roseivirga sp. BDSF3-8 TaxID=3241598 RepID=UPI003531A78E